MLAIAIILISYLSAPVPEVLSKNPWSESIYESADWTTGILDCLTSAMPPR